MNHLDVIQRFLEHGESRAPSADTLEAEFRKALEELGFRHFACCSHVDPLHPPGGALMMHNYPDGWVRHYSDAGFYANDPVLERAQRSPLPFFWDAAFRAEPMTRWQKSVLAEAAGFGLAHGYTAPLHLSWLPGSRRASCSVVPDHDRIDPRNYPLVDALATYLYALMYRTRAPWRVALPTDLPPRERQCLTLAATGKSDWDIGHILKLSEATVHTLIERAKRRLGVGTRMQAVIRALMSGEIAYGDLTCRNGSDRGE